MKELELQKGKKEFHLDTSKDWVFITLIGPADDHFDYTVENCIIELGYDLNRSEAMKLYEVLKKRFETEAEEKRKDTVLEKIEKHLEKLASCVVWNMDEDNNAFVTYSN